MNQSEHQYSKTGRHYIIEFLSVSSRYLKEEYGEMDESVGHDTSEADLERED